MPIPALLAPLLSQGLSILGNAVLSKGKDWVKEKTGIELDKPLSSDDILKLKQFELDHEEELLRLRLEDKKLDLQQILNMTNAIANEDNNISDRWKYDLTSDSMLSKIIRPATVIYILTAYLLFAGLSAAGIQINQVYVSLLGEWGMLVMTAYFGGRSIEKIVQLRNTK